MERAKIFVSYSHKDELLREDLDAHLSSLKREGIISGWHDAHIPAGENIDDSIQTQLESADVIILLISAYFLASDYCYQVEMTKALEKSAHPKSTTKVIPIIIKPCDWKNSPFKNIKVLPKDGKPVTSWKNIDEAWENVIHGIRSMISNLAFSARAEDVVIEANPSSYNFNYYLKESVDRLDESFNADFGSLSLTGLPALDDEIGNHSTDSLCLFLNDNIKLGSDLNTLIALNFATKKGLPVEYVTLDIPPSQLILRLVSQHSKIPLKKFLSEAGMQDEDWPQISSSITQIKDSKINFLDSSDTTFDKLIEKISTLTKQERNLIIIQGLECLDSAAISEEPILRFLKKVRSICKLKRKTIIISMDSSSVKFSENDHVGISKRLTSAVDLCIQLKIDSLKGIDEKASSRNVILDILMNAHAAERGILATYFPDCCAIGSSNDKIISSNNDDMKH
jgi:hypothetical protein